MSNTTDWEAKPSAFQQYLQLVGTPAREPKELTGLGGLTEDNALRDAVAEVERFGHRHHLGHLTARKELLEGTLRSTFGR